MAIVLWACSPTTTVSSGAPNSPLAGTSQPWRRSTSSRPTAIPVALATVAPVTKLNPVDAGRPSRSTTHPRTTSSRAAATGDITRTAAFWSHAPASQLAAVATGYDAPVTKPK